MNIITFTPSYASCQLKDHEKNYSLFLLKSAAAIWGMDVFNEYLKGKEFILFMDHKLLEKMGHLHTKTMNRLQAALLEHNFVIQYKKGAVMPADYLSQLPSMNTNIITDITESFDPFKAELIDLQRADANLQHMNHFCVKGFQVYQNLKKTICKILHLNSIRMPIGLSGSGWMTTNIPTQHLTFLRNITNWLYARPIIINLEGTMQHWKHTYALLPHTFGQKSTLMSWNTQKRVSSANREINPWTNHLLCSLCQLWANQISGSMLTFLAPCSLQDININTSCASPTHSRSTHWSHLLRTRKQKPSPRPFFRMVL